MSIDDNTWWGLRQATAARVGLATAGRSIGTRDHLAFRLAHAKARDAVHAAFDADALAAQLQEGNDRPIVARSQAPDRRTFLKRPDLGRTLDDVSRERLASAAGPYDIVLIIADGLSAQAATTGALPLLTEIKVLFAKDWRLAPLVVAQEARVALGDEIARALGADLAVIMLGERPGLSAPDSFGLYITWQPRKDHPDAERNCISNVRPGGLGWREAAQRLLYLCTEARRRRVTGTALKDDSAQALPVSANSTSAT